MFKKNGLIILLTNTRSGSTYLFDFLRSLPPIKLNAKYKNYSLMNLRGGRYPIDLTLSKSKTKIEVNPRIYKYIPDMYNSIQSSLFKGFDKYEIEKVHPHFFNYEADRFRITIKNISKRRPVKLIILLRNPYESILSFFKYSERNPNWSKGKIMPDFLLNQYIVINKLSKTENNLLLNYDTLINDKHLLLSDVCRFLWNRKIQNDELSILINQIEINTNREKRCRENSTPFLGTDNSEINLSDFYDSYMNEIKLMADLYAETIYGIK